MSSSRLCLSAVVISFPLAIGASGCSSDPSSTGSVTAASCSEAASDGVRDCIGLVNAAWEACYSDGDAPCASDDATVTAALAALRGNVEASCSDGEVMSDWFLRAVTDPDTLQSRVEEANFVNDIPGAQPYPCEVAP